MKKSLILGAVLVIASLLLAGCASPPAQSAGGVGKVDADVKVGSDGCTTEQCNIKHRLEMDNEPGVIKHIYVKSPINNALQLYSPVAGKVTSSGKRLTPLETSGGESSCSSCHFSVDINGNSMYTDEVMQDDGTYGSSIEYLYWFTPSGRYYQLYPGANLILISDQPVPLQESPLGFIDLSEN